MVEEVGRSGASAPSGHSAKPKPCSTVSAVPASVPNADFPEFVTFDVRTPSRQHSTEVTVRLKRAIRLYEDSRFSEYFRVRAIAKKRGKRQLGLHSCCTVIAEPRDWSDGVDAFTAKPQVSA